MKKLAVAPRSPEWHTIRSESWTASTAAMLVARPNAELLRDAAADVGITLDIAPLLAVGIESYFGNTPWKVWAEKTGRIPRFAGNADTDRGITNEELIITHFETDRMLLVEREVTATASATPWLLASFDGVVPAESDVSVLAPNGFPLEAKCPAFPSRKKLWDSKKSGDLAVMGLPYYWCQVQHQLMVAEAPYGWFVAAGVEPDEKTGEPTLAFPLIEKVPRDDAFLTAYMAVAEFYFNHYLDTYVEPPKLPTDVALLVRLSEQAEFDRAIAEADHNTAVELYLAALTEEGEAAKRRKDLEAKVISAAALLRAEGTDTVMLADRLQLTYTSTKSVSWQKVAKEVAKIAGMSEVPPSIIEACESKARDSVKLKEVV